MNRDFRFGLLASIDCTSTRLRGSPFLSFVHPDRLRRPRKGPALPLPGTQKQASASFSSDFSYTSPLPLLRPVCFPATASSPRTAAASDGSRPAPLGLRQPGPGARAAGEATALLPPAPRSSARRREAVPRPQASGARRVRFTHLCKKSLALIGNGSAMADQATAYWRCRGVFDKET